MSSTQKVLNRSAIILMILGSLATPMQAETVGTKKVPAPHLRPSIERFRPTDAHTLLEGYALLYALSGDESKVDLILLVKKGPKEFQTLIKDIANEAKTTHDQFDDMRSGEGSTALQPESNGLPEIERITRKSIAEDKQHRILAASQHAFEVELLVSQYEGLMYGYHLLLSLQEQEKSASRRDFLQQHAEKWKALLERVAEQLHR